MDYNEDVTNNGKDLNVILRSIDGGTYLNTKGTDLNAGSGVVAMSAYNGSSAANSGALNVSGYNAAIGMLAGNKSSAWNDGTEANGIHLTFNGYKKDNTIIGMYADVGSEIVNNGLIEGSASLTSEDGESTATDTTATKGSMIGMEVMIVNANNNSSSVISNAINEGVISLVAGQTSSISSDSVEVSLIGMGTYLDDGFINGSKKITRGEKAVITNNNTINLSYLGTYSSAGDYLQDGVGGIVGMKADANATAVNNKKIQITMSTSTDSGKYAVAAGMQSVHGGVITNASQGTITLSADAIDNRITYGMVAVKGNVAVSGLPDREPLVNNYGNINLQISNSYGMASYIGGTLNNNNTITLATDGNTAYTNNVGMYGSGDKKVNMTNNGTIHIYSNNSIAMKNESSGDTTITNVGTITIEEDATDSHPFAGTYSNIVNSGLIDYKATPNTKPNTGTNSSNQNSSSNATEPPSFPDTLAFTLMDGVVNTNGNNTLSSTSSGTSNTSGTEKVINTKDGIISLTGSSYTAAIVNNSPLGKVENNGYINLYDRSGETTIQSVGIYVTSTTVNGSSTTNNGYITVGTKQSAGMVSESTASSVNIINSKDGRIIVANEESVGMFTSKGSTADIKNYGEIEVQSKNSYAIISNGSGKIYNYGTIILSDDEAVAFYIGPNSTSVIVEQGTIKVTEGKKYTIGMRIDKDMTLTELLKVDEDIPDDFIYYEIGGNVITSFGKTTPITTDSVIFARVINGGTLTNQSAFSTSKDEQIIFKGLSGSTIINNAEITVQNQGAYAIQSEGTTNQSSATNNSTITITGASAHGLYATGSFAGATNTGTIDVEGANSSGLYGKNGATITNGGTSAGSSTVSGTLNVKNSSASGMYAEGTAGNKTTATNAASIKVSVDGANGISAQDYVDVNNGEGAQIEITKKNAHGISAQGAHTSVTNAGTILAKGGADADNNGAAGIYAENGVTVTNAETGIITASGSGYQGSTEVKAGGFGIYTTGGATITNSGTINSDNYRTSGIHSDQNETGTTTITNTGTINATKGESFGIYANSTGEYNKIDVTNNGTINVSGATTSTGSGARGIFATGNGAIVVNNTEGVINVGASGSSKYASFGIMIDNGASAENNHEIYVYDKDSIGISVNGDTLTTVADNLTGGTIYVNGSGSYAMQSLKEYGEISNSGTIEVSAENSCGLGAFEESSASNESGGQINVSGANGIGLSASSSTATNKSGATVTVTGANSFGMKSYAGGEIVNEGTIHITTESSSSSSSSSDDFYGMFAQKTDDADTTAVNYGSIIVERERGYAMITSGGASATNNYSIEINSANSRGMYAGAYDTITNNGTISISDDASGSYGMVASGASSSAANAKNHTITVSGSGNYGMYAGNTGTVTNYGTITISEGASGDFGMAAKGSGSTAINEEGATINVYGTNSRGMQAESGGTVINKGTINVTGTDSYGIYQQDTSSYYNDEGTINAPDEEHEIHTASANANALSFSAPMLLSANNSSTIINSGKFITNSALDFNSSIDDTSSVNIGNGGSFEALSFSGNVVADSDITLGGFGNEYTNENSFIGEDKGLNITSGSYLFDAGKSVNDNGNTDVVMTKKDFIDVVENSSLANFLENNYSEENNESLYNSLKSAKNSAQFNQNLDDLFSNDLLSNLTFEDLNTLREMNFDMNSNLLEQKKGAFALADGIETVKGEKFGSNGQYALNGYNNGTTSVAVGLSVADVRADNKSKYKNRLNKNIMLSMPVSHKTHGFELITSPKLGYAQGSYERVGFNGENYDGTFERKTFALMNEARYPFKLNGVKIVPNAEFNMIGFNIKGREDTKQYSLNIGSQNRYSVESGVGFNLEKEFMPDNDSKLKLSGGVSVYKEFADPYEFKVGMNEMNGNYKLKDEKHGDKRTVLRFGAGYNIKENLDISAMLRTNIDREYRTDTGLSLNYHF